MMLANEVRKLLKRHSHSLGINPDHIYSYSIDPNVRADEVKDFVFLISEVDDTPSQYGSNRSVVINAEIQIQIYFPNSYDGDTSVLRGKIRDLLEKHDWYCLADDAIKQDPDVQLLMNNTRWRKTYKK